MSRAVENAQIISSRVLTVVGLGPGGRGLLTIEALEAWESHEYRWVRTGRHLACEELRAAGERFETFDRIYEQAENLECAYDDIVDVLMIKAVEHHRILYGVPGSPWVAESTVRRLIERAPACGVDVRFVDGISFIEPALGVLGADPMVDGLVVLDGRAAEVPPYPSAPLLIAQVDSFFVLSDLKLALLEVYPPDHEVALLQALATSGRKITWVPLSELDHPPADTAGPEALGPGHLACVWVPPAGCDSRRPFPVLQGHRLAGRAFAELVALQDRLLGPGGCPWDAEQTHHSLAKYLVEETYEVTDAIEALPPAAPGADYEGAEYANLCEELGDHLYQAVFHACLADQVQAFDARDVVNGVCDKLIARHPHVFGADEPGSAEEVLATWEDAKRAEKGRQSALDGIARSAPALVRAAKMHGRARLAGVAWDADRAAEVLRQTVASETPEPDEFGLALLALAVVVREAGHDPEATLRQSLDTWAAAFRRHETGDVGNFDPWHQVLSRRRWP